ncbi:D-alanine--poly(phosphoribitol) ligase subunit 2 [Candidatus Brocadiaceae bacterium]|nr:D-alanine--poly(phosphoribitol) ligase subunit 2 [Candidatus Brocadiaceae bacterium]
MQDIEQAIKDFIVREFKPEVALDNDSQLIQMGIIDSFAIFMLIGFINEQFGVKIDPDDVSLENFETINTIRDLVMTRSH